MHPHTVISSCCCSVASDSVTPWIVWCQASLPFTISQSLLKLMSIEFLCHPTISFSFAPFSSCLQSLPASWSFPMSQLFTLDGQSTGASTSASALPMSIQDWLPLGLTGLISLQSKGLSRVFSGTTIQRHQFFCTQPSNNMNPHEPISLRTLSVQLHFPVYPYSPALLPLDTDFLSFFHLTTLPDQRLNLHPQQWKHTS